MKIELELHLIKFGTCYGKRKMVTGKMVTGHIPHTDLNDLIVKYNISRDLNTSLPPSGLVMSELLDDAIGIYNRSYNQSDVQKLSASVMKLWASMIFCACLSGLDQTIPAPTPEDLVAANPNTKVLAKAEASKKQRASTSGSAPSQVAKRTRSATTHSSKSSARPNLFDDNDGDDEESDDDDDTCVEIPLITPIHSAATIGLGGNQGGGSTPPGC
nr:hypothetical protein [Tanacetum cinerariifolium]